MDVSESDLFTLEDRIKAYRDHLDKYASRISIEPGGVVLDGHYFIPADQINTEKKLLCWVYHLCGKNWADAGFLERFMSICANHFGLDLHTK